MKLVQQTILFPTCLATMVILGAMAPCVFAVVPVTNLGWTKGIATGARANQHFDNIGQVQLGPTGHTAFFATLAGTGVDMTNNNGIWAEGTGGVKDLIVRAGDPAPGAPDGAVFAGLNDPIP